MKIVLVTGGFDPVHSGHINLLEEAARLGDQLVVGLNSDAWLTRKKGRPFMPYEDRLAVVRNLRMVKYTVEFNDDDNTAKEAIRKVRLNYPSDTIVFANGGDRNKDNIPEMDIADTNLEFVFGVGGTEKKNSSSWILQEWKAPKTERPWGYYRVLHEVSGCKVKELTIDPGKSLNMQRHFKRNEYWLVTSGQCDVQSMMDNGYMLPVHFLNKHSGKQIPLGDWHKLSNPYDEPCSLIEIQYGSECDEADIERNFR